jgi:arylsulfatase A-like enzyme
MTNRNLLFIMCDDLNLAIGPYKGHPQTITPHIDRLAARATVFENSYCNSPLCGPSRASLFSGLYPHTSEKFAFGSWEKSRVLSSCTIMQEHFRNHGFQVWGTGKLFHNGREDDPVYHDHGYGLELGPWPDKANQKGRPYHPDLSSLFDSDEDFSIYCRWEATFGPLSNVPDWSNIPNETRKPGWFMRDKPFRYVNDDDRDLMPDEENAQWAVDKIRQAGDEPFSLFVGFNRPHTPLYAPKKYFDKFPIEEIVIPEHYNWMTDKTADITDELYSYGRRRHRLYENYKPYGIKSFIQAYLACVNFVDDQVGVILDALEASGHDEDTMVVFTSDNGYHLGQKGMTFKCTLFEESCRIPLIIREGGQTEPRRIQQRASLVDLYPTFNEAFGMDPAPNKSKQAPALDGSSLIPLLSGKNGDKELGGNLANIPTTKQTVGTYGPEVGPAHFTLYLEGLKYNLYGNGEEELFELENDPLELQNIADDPEWADSKDEMRHALLARTPDWFLNVEPEDWEERKWDLR